MFGFVSTEAAAAASAHSTFPAHGVHGCVLQHAASQCVARHAPPLHSTCAVGLYHKWLVQLMSTSLSMCWPLVPLDTLSVCHAAAGDVLGVLLYLNDHPEQLHNRTIFQSEVLGHCPLKQLDAALRSQHYLLCMQSCLAARFSRCSARAGFRSLQHPHGPQSGLAAACSCYTLRRATATATCWRSCCSAERTSTRSTLCAPGCCPTSVRSRISRCSLALIARAMPQPILTLYLAHHAKALAHLHPVSPLSPRIVGPPYGRVARSGRVTAGRHAAHGAALGVPAGPRARGGAADRARRRHQGMPCPAM